MSRYMSYASVLYNQLTNGTSDTTGVASLTTSSTKPTITIASAQQVPAIGTPAETKETEKLMVENFNGGLSFSVAESFRESAKQNNLEEAKRHLVTLVERLAIF